MRLLTADQAYSTLLLVPWRGVCRKQANTAASILFTQDGGGY